MKPGLQPDLKRSNRIVSVWFDPVGKTFLVQGKRVGKNCPMTQSEVRTYVRKGGAAAIRQIQVRLNCDLREAFHVLKLAKKGRW